MPELPEVEAVREGIEEQLVGRRIVSIDNRLPKFVEGPPGLEIDALLGEQVVGVERRGKYLAILFPELAAVLHLKLAGQVVLRGGDTAGFAAGHPVPAFDVELPHKSTHLIFEFDNGSKLYVTDIRHFGRLRLMAVGDLPGYWSDLELGPDARSTAFNLVWFAAALKARTRSRVKPLLLDQRFLAGLGNIYVDESLHLAGIHPERLSANLTEDEVLALYDAIVDVINIAVPMGGAEILNGKAVPDHGEFPFIHGREGEPCLRCGTTIVKIRVNNRGTYVCPTCQTSPSSR